MTVTCPAPADLFDNKQDHRPSRGAIVACVNTSPPPAKHWPERDRFFDFWDERKRAVKLKHDSVIARMAGLDGSAPSGWRSGRQRPSTASLKAIAPVLETSAQELWAAAGLLAPADFEQVKTPSIREDLATIDRALRDPSTPAEDLVVIEATLEMLLARLEGRANRKAA
jgi:transcriptional regulator with XRE-family HTH domain